MVRIYMAQINKPSEIREAHPNDYSEEDKQFDLEEAQKYKTKTNRELITDIKKLFRWLCYYFFTEN